MEPKNKSSNHSKRKNIAEAKVDRKASNNKLDDVKSGWSFGRRKNKSKSAEIDSELKLEERVDHELGGIYDELLESVVSEYRILKQIRQLKEAREAGCRSSAEAHIYIFNILQPTYCLNLRNKYAER